MFSSVGGSELLVIFLIILIFFGADKLPELMRGIGQGMNEFRKASDNLKDELEKGKRDLNDTFNTDDFNPYNSSPEQDDTYPGQDYFPSDQDQDFIEDDDEEEWEVKDQQKPNQN
jgi:sec-independent protein translocase protein TatA